MVLALGAIINIIVLNMDSVITVMESLKLM